MRMVTVLSTSPLLIAAAILLLSACTGTGEFSAAAICETSGGRWAKGTCAHVWTPTELATRQWCETHGGVYLTGDDECVFGTGGP